jgi:hypothetical protein
MNTKTLINFINDIEIYKNKSIETLIQERLEKTFLLYLKDLDRSFNSIMTKKNRMVVIKELSKNGI